GQHDRRRSDGRQVRWWLAVRRALRGRQRDGFPRRVPRGRPARAHRADVRAGGHPWPPSRDDHLRRTRRSHEAHDDLLFDTTQERDGVLEYGGEQGMNETYAHLDAL